MTLMRRKIIITCKGMMHETQEEEAEKGIEKLHR